MVGKAAAAQTVKNASGSYGFIVRYECRLKSCRSHHFPQNDMTKLQTSIANLIGSTKNFKAQIERIEAKMKADREAVFPKIIAMLKTYRSDHHLKNSTLASQIGISGDLLTKVITGDREFSLAVLEKLEKWLEKNA